MKCKINKGCCNLHKLMSFVFLFCFFLFLVVPTAHLGLRLPHFLLFYAKNNYSQAPRNDVSVNDGPHIRQWSQKFIILRGLEL